MADILERIARINFAESILIEAERDPEKWEDGEVAFDAILYNLLVIGEAVKTVGEKMKSEITSPLWNQIAGMRDILAHEYFRVDGKIVRATIDQPLQELKKFCEKSH